MFSAWFHIKAIQGQGHKGQGRRVKVKAIRGVPHPIDLREVDADAMTLLWRDEFFLGILKFGG